MAPFKPQVLLQGLKDRAESITSYADRLYVGTNIGTLHIYGLEKDTNGLIGLASLVESKRSFTRRAIEQLGFIKDVNSLITLSDTTVTLYPLPGLAPPTPLAQARGAMSFALDTSIQFLPAGRNSTSSKSETPSSRGAPSCVTYLAVGCRKKVVIYTWKDGEAQEVKELVLPHSPRIMTFPTSSTLVMAYTPGEYAILSIPTMTVTEPPPLPAPTLTQAGGMAALGKGALSGLGGYMTLGLVAKAKPSVIKLTEGEFALTKDNQTIFLDAAGKLTRESGYDWPSPPDETTFVKPYLLSTLPAGSVPITSPGSPSSAPTTQISIYPSPVIQIVSSLSLLPVQTLPYPFPDSTSPDKPAELPKPYAFRVLSSSPGSKCPAFVVATPTERAALAAEGSTVWALNMLPWGTQLDELVNAGSYGDALTLLATLDAGVPEDKEQRVALIRGLHAVWLFQNGKYDDAIKTFIELEINPAKVIALYPESIAGRLSRPPETWIELFGGQPQTKKDVKNDAGASDPSASAKPDEQPAESGSPPRPPSPKGSVAGTLTGTLKATLGDLVPNMPNMPGMPNLPGVGGGTDDSARKGTVPRGKDKVKDDFTRSIESLLVFLGDRRPKLSGALAALHITPSKSPELPPLSEISTADLFALPNGSPSTLIPEQLLRFAQVVDTALFKSYLVVRPSLLGSLCRLDNWCEVEEVEEVLKKREKFDELKDLYKGKKMHERALALLKERSTVEDDAIEKIDPTIRYLQKLGPEHLGLIFAWSKWVFDADSTRALQIFTADEVDLPRVDVANYLESRDPKLAAKYMEFLIDELHETSKIFHNRLAAIYLGMTKDAKARGDEAAQQSMYEKLLKFANASTFYESDRLFTRLPSDDFFELRAIILGRMGRHEGALDIYVNRLRDYVAAEDYCKRVYQSNSDPRGVFLTLLQIYLRPSLKTGSSTPRDQSDVLLAPALDLISRHSPRIDSVETLQLLPPLVKATDVRTFLQEVLQSNKVNERIAREIWKARGDQVDRKLMALQSRRVRVTDNRICPQCHKRLGNSVIAVHFPRGEVTHYQCREAFSKKLVDTFVR